MNAIEEALDRDVTDAQLGIASGSKNKALGSITLHRERGQLELSYSLVPDAWGRGFALESCQAVIEWVWTTTDESSLIAVTQTANQPSTRLLDKLGFVEDSRFEEHGAQQSLHILRRD